MKGKREFYRKAYLKNYPKKGSISFPDPPSKLSESPFTIILSMLPAIAMGASIFLSVSRSSDGKLQIPLYMIVMCIGFLTAPIVSVSRYFDSKKKYNKEKEYWESEIEKISGKYVAECEKSKKLLIGIFKPYMGEKLTSQENYEKIAEDMPPFLWNSLPGDGDYAKAYIGTYTADVLFQAEVSKGVKILEKDVQAVWDEKKNLVQTMIANTPFIYDFMLYPALGICGGKNTMQSINEIVINMALRHGYDRMKVALISNQKNFEENYAYIKWLPHIWNSRNTRRMIALCEEDIYELENEISDYYHLPQREQSSMFLLCIIDDFSYLEKKPLLRWINEKRFGTFLFSIFKGEKAAELPSSCEHYLCVSDKNMEANYFDSEVISYEDNQLKGIYVQYDSCDKDSAEKITRKLASVKIMDTENTSDIPSKVNFLENEMIASVENFDISKEWKDYKDNITACIGTGSENRKVMLDFSDGINIHMIVIGTSGSGKSQFLISMVLDMMMHYSAEQINFVFMDFKGNAFSSAFSHKSESGTLIYPNHIVGSISNIESDGEYQITRIRTMLKKEISRRENLLTQAVKNGKITEAKIDLYQKKFKSKGSTETVGDVEFVPMPELFLIVDEFMELLDSYGSIISEFNMIARTGRSLGIHLILSAQKMSGRLSPQISANAGTRICFRVIDPSDSVEMIGTDDACYIDSNMFGRSYFKSGITLKEFQSPLSDTAYTESTAPSFGEVDSYGKIKETKYKETKEFKITQRQAVIGKICQTQEYIKEKIMVLTEPLPEMLDFEKNTKEITGDVSGFPIGKRDNIYSQCYDIAEINFQRGNWEVQGIARCGKTNLLIVLLLSAAYYSKNKYSFFLCDLQSSELKKYCFLKNVSPQLIDNIERLTRLIYYLMDEIKRRKNKNNGEYDNTVIIIDNYDYIVEKYEYILPELSSLFTRGPKYNIWFVVAHTEKITGYQSKSVDFYNKVVMMQKTESNYSNLVDLRDVKRINRVPGRGFITGDTVLEMQTFTLPYNPTDEKELIKKVNEGFENSKKHHEVKVLPATLNIKDFNRYFESHTDNPNKFFVGISSLDLQPVSIPLFEKHYLAVTCSDAKFRIDFIKTFLQFHLKTSSIWRGKKILVVTKNDGLKNMLEDIFIENFSYSPGEEIPDICLLDLRDIRGKMKNNDVEELDRVINELREEERIVITENIPDFYNDLEGAGREAFFNKFIGYFMNIYKNEFPGAWINCLTEADLNKRSEFLACKVEQRDAEMLSQDEPKNLQLGIGQYISENKLLSIDIPYSGVSLPPNQAWLRENGRYSRVLCIES